MPIGLNQASGSIVKSPSSAPTLVRTSIPVTQAAIKPERAMTAEPRTSGASESEPSLLLAQAPDGPADEVHPCDWGHHRDEVGMKGDHQRVQARVSCHRCAIGLGPQEDGKRPKDQPLRRQGIVNPPKGEDRRNRHESGSQHRTERASRQISEQPESEA